MVSSGQKLQVDSSPTYLPDWEVPLDSTGQRRQIGGGFSVGKRFKFLKAAMASSHPAASVHYPVQGNPVQPIRQNVAGPLPVPTLVSGSSPPLANPDQPKPRSKKWIIIRGIEWRKNRIITLFFFCMALVAIALGIGLGLGLRKKRFLPLPTDTGVFNGDLTYYEPGLGACGVVSLDNENIVSVSHFLFDSKSIGSDPNHNPLCNLRIRAERFDTAINAQRSIDLVVMDRCTGCGPTDLDVSPGAFAQLANMAQGRVDVTWAWLSFPPRD